ncbi:MAG: hypothetical protein IPO26_13980 [Saprospiraceae bacterium]|nr:hypothetical protein [Saprospiraceae bacterium]
MVQTSGGSSVYYNGSEITGMQDDNGDPRDDDDADSTPDVDPDNDNPVTMEMIMMTKWMKVQMILIQMMMTKMIAIQRVKNL